MRDKPDAELVALARAGDKRAFGELVERYQPMALRVAVRLTAHEELARDLAQEALLEAYLSLRHLRDEARFGSWLYGIMLNVCRGYLRDRRADFFSLEAMRGGTRIDGPLPIDPAPSPQEIAEERDLHRHVLAAVAALPPSEREATLLFYYDQLTVREIAAALGITANAVKARLHKSRRRLRQSLWMLHESGTERSKRMRKVSIADVVKHERTNDEGQTNPYYIVVLHDEVGGRALPIWVGPWEGQSIAMGLNEFGTPRPMTYAFMANLLAAAGVQVESVQVASLKDETFYAAVVLRSGSGVREVDARPSDALALALRTGTPIYVADEVLERAGFDVPGGAAAAHTGAGQIMGELQSVLKPWAPQAQPTTPDEAERSRREREQTQHDLIAQVFGG